MALIARIRSTFGRLDDLIIARSILTGSLALASLLFAQTKSGGDLDWWMALPLALVALANLPLFVLSARGHRVGVSWAVVVVDTCLITYLVHVTSGAQGAVAVFYVWPIIAANLLLGARAGYLTAAVTAALYVGLAAAEAGGWEPRALLEGRGLSVADGLDGVLVRASAFLLIALLSGLVSNALLDSNARLSQAKADAERDLDRTKLLNRRLTILDEVGRILGRIQDLDILLPRALGRVAGFLGVEAGMIVLFGKDRSDIQIAARQSLSEATARDLLAGDLPVSLDANRGAVLGSADGRSARALRTLQPLGYADFLAAPLRLGPEYVGNLYLFTTAPNPFRRGDVALMDSLCSQLAIAVKNVAFTRELKDANDELVNLDQLKSDFLATMSHELRTPLTSIIGYSDMLLSGMTGEVTDKQRDFLRSILNSGEALLDLINDILDLTKIEAGKLELSLEPVNLRTALASVLSVVKPRAKEKNLQISTFLPNDLPPLWADSGKLNQVLLNLLTNAIEYTPETGRIGIEARPTPDGLVEIRVNDTGVGIEPADLARIFERFTQVDNTSTRSQGGTGLGLAITRDLIELHQGTITVKSQPGRGSQFIFTIPQAGAQKEPRSRARLA
ncbi:MAG TPA: ATP-binding protein [Thermoleophilia bacterium]|nr:ATP-binding protein [Thermoleophilia bacterium]